MTPEILGAWVVAIAAAAVAAFKIWRAKSSTELANTKDDVEGKGLKFVMAGYEAQIRGLVVERDSAKREADEAWTRRMLDAATIAKLEAQNVHLTSEVAALRAEVERLHGIVQRFMPSDPTNPIPPRSVP